MHLLSDFLEETMNISDFPNARKKGLVVQEVPNEVLIYDLESDKAHCLNETAAAVWRFCDGKTPVQQIAREVGRELGREVSDDLVWLAIDQLSEHRLLESEIRTAFKGESRREALKKIGLASMVALPIIASLAAPRSVLANVSCACTTPTHCTNTSCPSTTTCNTGIGLCAPLPPPVV